MKYPLLTLYVLFTFFAISQKVTFSSNKRLVEPVLNREVKADNIIELKNTSSIPKTGSRKIVWSINGTSTPGKDWDLAKGSAIGGETIKVSFNKLGNYTVGLTILDTDREGNENEISEEIEDYISVRSVFPELAALYAQKPKPNYVKLVERADEFVVKPKFANDPTPQLFLAKGYLGIVKTGNPDPRFESAIEDAISSFAAAKELDKNGVIFDAEHQAFLNELEVYLHKEFIEVFLDDETNLDQLSEALDYYSQVTFAPISVKFLEAFKHYSSKNVKAANLIWSTEIPKLKKYTSIESEDPYIHLFKDELGNTVQFTGTDLAILKLGITRSALIFKTRDANNFKACELLEIVEPIYIDEKDFAAFYSDEFNSCMKK